MRKSGSKVGSINIGLSCAFGEKESVAARTKDVYCVIPRQVRQTHWQYRLALTKDVGAATKVCHAVLFIHGVHTPIRNNVAVVV